VRGPGLVHLCCEAGERIIRPFYDFAEIKLQKNIAQPCTIPHFSENQRIVRVLLKAGMEGNGQNVKQKAKIDQINERCIHSSTHTTNFDHKVSGREVKNNRLESTLSKKKKDNEVYCEKFMQI